MLFLEKVRRHNKWLFIAFLSFAIGQLLFFGRGVTCSPWYNSGMFSEVIQPKSSYQLYKVTPRNGAFVCWLSPQQDDKVFFTLDQYHAPRDRRVYDQLVKVYGKAGLTPPAYDKIIHPANAADFCRWFVPYAQSWLDINDSSCTRLQPAQANWDGQLLDLKQK